MAKAASNKALSLVFIILVLVLWFQKKPTTPQKEAKPSSSLSYPKNNDSKLQPNTQKAHKQSGYERHEGVQWLDDNGNDGDSFRLKLNNGETHLFRLYFVDSPESKFRTYRNGATNHQRIEQQADAMGVITPQQAVEIGMKAKQLTRALLSNTQIVLYTKWDDPFNDQRYHAHIQFFQDGKWQWLHRTLVQEGLVRIHTKGDEMPDGTTLKDEKTLLYQIEKEAKSDQKGAWRL